MLSVIVGTSETRRGISRLANLGKPEVEDLHSTLRRNLDIGRFQVAVDDALFVRGFEGCGDLSSNLQGLLQRHSSASDSLGKSFPFHEFEHQERGAASLLLKIVDDGNIRMIQRSQNSRLALKPRGTVRSEVER